MSIRVVALTERSSLVVALTMMVPDWDVDAVDSAEAVTEAGAHDALIIEAATTAAGAGTLATLRQAGTDGPAVIVGDVEPDEATPTVDGHSVVILTRPFTIAELRDHIATMVGPTAETVPPPPIVAKRDRRLPWCRGDARRADDDAAAPEAFTPAEAEPRAEPEPEPVTPPASEAQVEPPPHPGDVEPDAATATEEASVPDPEAQREPEPEPEPDVAGPTSAPRFTVGLPDADHRTDPLLLPTSRPDEHGPDEEPSGTSVGAEHAEPDVEPPPAGYGEAPDARLLVTLPDTWEETAAVGDALEVTVLMAEVLNAFEPVTAAVWVPDETGAWIALASLGLRRAESRLHVPADQPLFAAVAENLHGVLLSPADLARGYLGGIPGSWTEDIMAVGVGPRHGCDAVVVVGGSGFVDKDVRRLVSLAALSATDAPRGLSRLAGLVRR